MFEACQNPICGVKLDLEGKPKRKRRFCSEECKINGWVLKRAGELLSSLPAERKLDILAGLLSSNGNQWVISGEKERRTF